MHYNVLYMFIMLYNVLHMFIMCYIMHYRHRLHRKCYQNLKTHEKVKSRELKETTCITHAR